MVCAYSEKVPCTDEKPISVKPKGKKSPVILSLYGKRDLKKNLKFSK